ncbi:MAG: dTDP-4-dehydrorhamnose reductase [Proteobacteria bacterium]|nr:dTDP-4-dehydrorhamnose reductase [Pseudomonadota bacterium]
MRILLTGCDGQVGCEISRKAPGYGFDVIATDIGNLDITDIGAIRRLQGKHQAEIFINAAAYTAVDKAESEQQLAHDVNALGAKNLATVARECNLPILHISTDYIFSGNASTPYKDDSEPDPQGVYGVTKLAGERLVAQSNARHLTLRTSWVFGIDGQNFVKTMLRLGSEKDEVSVVADQFGSPTYAGHIATALLMLTEQYQQQGDLPWGNYNFCDNDTTTWHLFATKIMQMGQAQGLLTKLPVVHPIRTEDYPTPATRPLYSVLDCSLFEQTFPDIGISSWQSGLREMIGVLAGKGN